MIPSLIYSFWLKVFSSISNLGVFGSSPDFCTTGYVYYANPVGGSLNLYSPSKCLSLYSYKPFVTSWSLEPVYAKLTD